MHTDLLSFLRFMLLALVQLSPAIAQQTSPANCSEMTWQQCAQFTKEELQNAKDDETPARAIRIVSNYWAPAFEKAYLALGESENVRDADKIKDEIEGAVEHELKDLSGYTKVKDEVVDTLLKRYLPRLAPILAAISGVLAHPAIEAAAIFFWPSSIATDTQELKLANEDIHRDLANILEPHMRKQWTNLYFDSLKRAGGPVWEQGRPLP